jgi:hypothetical protein
MLMYCLVTVNGLFSDNFVSRVKSLDKGVKDIFAVYGEFDFVITLSGVNADKLTELVAKIKDLQEVNIASGLFVTDRTNKEDVVY